jgi:hypothetical protein
MLAQGRLLEQASTATSMRPPRGRNVDRGREPRHASLASDLGPPRDFEGYGRGRPCARWPGDARIAVNFNLNVEAGGERSILDGNPVSEDVLTDIGYPSLEA